MKSKNKIWSLSLRQLRITTLILICFVCIAIGISAVFRNSSSQAGKNPVSSANRSVHPTRVEIKKPKLAIIIDDFGQSRTGVKEMMEINRPLTIAVMPFLSYSQRDAEEAHRNGYEVIVHLPMQSQNIDIKSWLGPDPVEVSQDNNEIEQVVIDSLNDIPHAVGVNIHMGVLASRDERVIECVMSLLKQKNCYFIDSRTTGKSVCDRVSKRVGINYGKRSVFLDNGTKNKDYIKKQLLLAADIAEKYGNAIAIGHVGSMGGVETAESIKEMIPEIEARGIQLTFVSQVVSK